MRCAAHGGGKQASKRSSEDGSPGAERGRKRGRKRGGGPADEDAAGVPAEAVVAEPEAGGGETGLGLPPAAAEGGHARQKATI